MIRALMSELISAFKDLAQLQPIFREQSEWLLTSLRRVLIAQPVASFTMSHSTSNVFDEPERLADFAAAVSTGDAVDLQSLLESTSIEDRLQKALLVLKKELINAQLQQKISRDVESKIQKRQREYYLMEQLKGIKKELGMESDGKDKLVERFREKAAKLAMPEGVRKVFDEEMGKLMGLEPVSSEFKWVAYSPSSLMKLIWCQCHSELPGLAYSGTMGRPLARELRHRSRDEGFGRGSLRAEGCQGPDIGVLGCGEAERDCGREDHLSGRAAWCGEDEYWEEYRSGARKAVLPVRPISWWTLHADILQVLGWRFGRCCRDQRASKNVYWVSSCTDVFVQVLIHPRAMPGKPIQALKKVATENPLILIDEVDKISPGRGHNGDPSSALLEMLDPEQNSSFLDH